MSGVSAFILIKHPCNYIEMNRKIFQKGYSFEKQFRGVQRKL